MCVLAVCAQWMWQWKISVCWKISFNKGTDCDNLLKTHWIPPVPPHSRIQLSTRHTHTHTRTCFHMQTHSNINTANARIYKWLTKMTNLCLYAFRSSVLRCNEWRMIQCASLHSLALKKKQCCILDHFNNLWCFRHKSF